jgi:hypothetical protein
VEGVTVEPAGVDMAGADAAEMPVVEVPGPVVGPAPEVLPPLTSLGPTPVIRGERRVEVMRLVVWHYRAGVSIRAIGARVDRSYGFVMRLMWQAREPRRRPGGANRGRRRPLPGPSTWHVEDFDRDSVPGKVVMWVRMPQYQADLLRPYCKPGEPLEEMLMRLLHEGLMAAGHGPGSPGSDLEQPE